MDETTAIPRPDNAAEPQRAGGSALRDESVDAARLVADHQDQIARLVCRLLGTPQGSDDVVQEVFLAAIEGLDRFRGQCRLSTWLVAIAVNKCRSTLRRRAVRRRLLVDRPGLPEPRTHEEPDDVHEEVARAVARLPAKYREPIVLRYYEEMPAEEIAVALGLTRNTVEVRLTRARRKLETTLRNRLT